MKFLYVLPLLCGLSTSTTALDREAFTFTKYDLEVRVEADQQRLAVRGKVTLRNDASTPQKNLSLQISSSLSWRSIQIDNKPIEFISQSYTSDIDHTGSLSEAIVTLPQELSAGGKVELQIGYEGTIPLNTTRLTRIGVPDDVARKSDWDRIDGSFTAVRGIGFVTWYPVAMNVANLSENNNVAEIVSHWQTQETQAEMNLKLRYSGVGNPQSLLCNGNETNQQNEELDRTFSVSVDCSFAPLGLTVPSFVADQYERITGHLADIYAAPEHRSLGIDFTSAAENVTGFVHDWFGDPRGKIIIAELPDVSAFPFASRNLLLTPFSKADPKQTELTVVRQLTHASFLSPRLWISEGLTHFAQALYREQQDGRFAALEFMKLHRQGMLAAEKIDSSDDKEKVARQNSLINTSIEELYRGKAMYVWWMLRDMVGEPALKKALASYVPEQDNEPSYVQHLIEAQSKKDLEWFFDDWVYRDQGLPDLRVVSIYPRKNLKEGYLVTVLVENLGDAGVEVPVIVHHSGGEAVERLIVRGKSRASVRVSIANLPEEVTLNDGTVPENDMSNNTFTYQPPPAENQ